MTKLAENAAFGGGRRHALRNMSLAGVGLAVLLVLALSVFNEAPIGAPRNFSPLSGILIVAVGSIGFLAFVGHYLKRTDEHDLSANLWSFSWAWLTFSVIAPAWWVLNHSGLAGPVNFWAVFGISAVVSGIVWAWLRLR